MIVNLFDISGPLSNVSNDFRRLRLIADPRDLKKSIDTHIVSNKRIDIDISSRSRGNAIYRFFCVFVGPSPSLRC